MLSYWFMWPAILFFGLSFYHGGAAAGWTSYPVLSDLRQSAPYSGSAQTYWLLGVTFVGVSSMMGSVNYMTTIINMRAPGMTLFRMPLTIWAMFITAILQAFALPVLTAAGFMLVFDRLDFGGYFEGIHSTFFVPSGLVVNNADPTVGGGQPLLWQHLFWFYSHPAVYIMLLPAMGMVSDILACMCRKPIFGYKPMVYSMAAIAGLGFIVWGHHMFTSGMNPALGMTFMVSTMMIALPSAVKVFNWIGTIWGGRVQFNVPMLNCTAFVSMFIVGGLSGIFMSSVPTDIYFHDTYMIVAHFHYIIFGATLFGVFGGIHFWFPKNVRQDDERDCREVAFLPDLHWVQRYVLPDAHVGDRRLPAALRRSVLASISRTPDAAESVHHVLGDPDGVRSVPDAGQLLREHLQREENWPKSVERQRTGVDCSVASRSRQL